MSQPIESLLAHYESGRMSRRDLVALLTALAAAPLPAVAQPAPAALQAATLNHASLIVANLERSVEFYQRTFGLEVKSTQQGGVNLAVGDAFLGIYQGGAERDTAHQSRLFRYPRLRPRGDGGGARGAGAACGIAHARRCHAGLHGRSRQPADPAARRQLLRRRRAARQRVPRVVAERQRMEVVLTGIKPTGQPHIGNYVGAMKPAVASSQATDVRLVFLPRRLPRDRRRRRRGRSLDARDRRELAGRRPRPEPRHALPAVRRTRDPRSSPGSCTA